MRSGSSFSKEQPVWLLGRCYHRKSSPSSPSTSMTASLEIPSAMGIKPQDLENQDQQYLEYDNGEIECGSIEYPTEPLEEEEPPEETGTDVIENYEEGMNNAKDLESLLTRCLVTQNNMFWEIPRTFEF